MNTEAPVNTGHAFANMAEDYEDREDWLKAAEAHSNAAAQFEIALQDTTDVEATRTLRLLSSNHTRKANELNRKVQRINMTAQKQSKQSKKSGSSLISKLSGVEDNGSMPHAITASTMGNGRRITEIGESYAILSNDEQEDDPFNKFLEAVDGLVDQLFNPAIAFTSAPLDENDNPISSIDISRTQEDEKHMPKMDMTDSYYLVPTPRHFIDQERLEEDTDDREENEKLKAHILQLTKRLKSLEISAEENNMLKSSVLQFRKDVHRQAKKIMQSYHESAMRASATTLLHHNIGSRYLPLQTTSHGPNSELVLRLKELEDENKQLRIQNEKQNALMNRYKERWEMLKENAKKRRASNIPDKESKDMPP
ncbi:hypothetical protein BD560DRAFT_416622 [Blakeslea trispora]|nr:hypothetical protein BD560DRAFT_416622 [Blakeslea trispora]